MGVILMSAPAGARRISLALAAKRLRGLPLMGLRPNSPRRMSGPQMRRAF